MKFADGKLSVADLQIVAPLEPYGHVKLFEHVKNLGHAELVKLAQAFELPTHGLLSTHTLMLMIAHHAQKLWYAEMGAVPVSVEKNYAAQLEKYSKLVQDLVEGKENAMASEKKSKGKKAKGAKVAKAPKAESKPLVYKVLSSKIDSKLAKKLENKEAKVHDTIILQVLNGMNGDASLSAISAEVKKTGRWESNHEIEVGVRWHLNKLEKLGLVAAKEA